MRWNATARSIMVTPSTRGGRMLGAPVIWTELGHEHARVTGKPPSFAPLVIGVERMLG